jgi:hypothetical protein
MKDQVSHPYKITGKIIVLLILIRWDLQPSERTNDKHMTEAQHYPWR